MQGVATDTICALSTPPGIGGLAVVRISGPEAIAIVDRCFRGKRPLHEVPTHTIHYGHLLRPNGSIADEVTCAVFRAPHSYTGEDVVEITCHGGYLMYRLVLESLTFHGARIAQPGEFTRRAFLNGRMDLVQVESIAEIIHTQVIAAQELAIKQLGGSFTAWARRIRDSLQQVASLVEVELDFAHEDIEFADRQQLVEQLQSIQADCRRFIRSYTGAQILRHGLRVGIVGYPNAGKSSLFNAILGRQRAIVSPQPGTTRDYLEDTVHVGQALLRLYDTAGFRESEDAIEVEGIALARSILEQCHVILVVNDLTEGQEHSDALAASLRAEFPTLHHLLVQNKRDLCSSIPEARSEHELFISARTGEGIEQLLARLEDVVRHSTAELDLALINQRHVESLQRIEQAVDSALRALADNLPGECIAIDLRTAAEELSTLIGERWTNDLLDRIFSQYCIGK
ncbi:MAG: tRNA uridine-5-carboxymethylaminomethyl(34) synthesis GTPase MnmE [Candidatus Kapabacteria bacterium]|nr:tRNA uridine-5-carboxymethylaminomethyl(34) synthesis GTPase MnmE [Candidatus Kapabacteria bacterium]MCS7302910.1 tRNA uridine-5-carboxymethylaminomethyl(34) synthesis GTPase MnmE [Candidatus Kapabacteria bacterium]MCX7937464.1 tRNA uridine-5-carboxymethylaminomethyl(34) synthesis GTPase MnmE [Chlorobiota bacterium]